MAFETTRYGYTRRLPGRSFDDAKAAITEALKAEGFGVLTEIDVKDTLKRKLNEDFRQYAILGACNPQLAHRALQQEVGIGLLLPCNVCVWEEAGGVVVAIARPDAMFEMVGNAGLESVARDADARLRRALEAVA